MAVCYDLANGAGLTIKCPYVCGAQQSPDCGIFIVGATGGVPASATICPYKSTDFLDISTFIT